MVCSTRHVSPRMGGECRDDRVRQGVVACSSYIRTSYEVPDAAFIERKSLSDPRFND